MNIMSILRCAPEKFRCRLALPNMKYNCAILFSNMDYWSVNKWNIELLAKYPTINCTGFGCNNMVEFFDYQMLGNRFVLKLK